MESKFSQPLQNIEDDLKKLFEDLKGNSALNTIDFNTFISLLIHLNLHQEEPEFFNYFKNKTIYNNKITEEEFINLFKMPKIINSNDPEEIKNIFKIFDIKKKGSINIEDFKNVLKWGPFYNNKKSNIDNNLEDIFEGIKELYNNTEITPLEFFDIIKEVGDTYDKKYN